MTPRSRARAIAFALAVVAPVAAQGMPTARAEPTERLSLPTQTDAEGWAESGFRLALGYAYGWEVGLEALPSATTHTFLMRAGARLDADWSLLGTLQYAAAGGDLDALSYLVTIDPTWHLGPHLELALGFGFGGVSGASSDQPYPNPDTEDADPSHSLTLPDAAHPLDTCDGRGPAALARVSVALPLGEIWSVALHAEGHARWLACEAQSGEIDDATGDAIVLRQWWAYVGANLGLTFAWR